jgi:hypothetical protein
MVPVNDSSAVLAAAPSAQNIPEFDNEPIRVSITFSPTPPPLAGEANNFIKSVCSRIHGGIVDDLSDSR